MSPSLRERRRSELRRQLSQTATAMFLEHGFEAVRVRDVAEACGVTEKTVFNHFSTKESLVLDRWDDLAERLRAGLRDVDSTPTRAVVAALLDELGAMTAGAPGPEMLATVRRFGRLLATTPALRTHNRTRAAMLEQELAGVLAARAGRSVDDPRIAVAAAALGGLVAVFYASLRRHAASDDVHLLRRRIRRDLERAAAVLEGGI